RALVQFLEAQAAAAGNAGAWDQADGAIQRAQALASRHGVKANQRNRLDMLQSTQDLERGRFGPARDRLLAVVQRVDSGDEKAMHWRLLALAEWGQGRPAAAVQAADQARIALAAQPRGINALLAQQVWAQMASADGRHAEAERGFNEVRQGMLSAGLAPDSESLRRLRRVQGEALLRAGRDAQALSALRSLWVELQAVPHGPREASLLRTALGCAEMLAGQPSEALAHWQQVQQEQASRLVPGHPWHARAAWLVAMADAGGDLPAARLAYLSTLAEDSPLRRGAGDCRAVI
ncbi:hypothetical protein LDC_0231, partial [sediment metagenome]